MTLRVVRLGSARQAGEGLRIGTVRRPPRGVRKSDYARRNFYDVWLPELAPSQKWVSWALASIAGRFLTGTTVGALIDAIGYVNFYVLTTLIALPGVILFWYMIRSGLADLSIGSAGKEQA